MAKAGPRRIDLHHALGDGGVRRHAVLAVARFGEGEHDELLLGRRQRGLRKRFIDRERRGGLGEHAKEVGNEAEGTLDPFEQRAACGGRGFEGA